MDVLQASQDLVEEVADVVVAQLLGLQQLVKVRLHQSLHDVAGGEGVRVKGHYRYLYTWHASRGTQKFLAIRKTEADISNRTVRVADWVKDTVDVRLNTTRLNTQYRPFEC